LTALIASFIKGWRNNLSYSENSTDCRASVKSIIALAVLEMLELGVSRDRRSSVDV
jgi:hypothetical protein